MDLVVILHSALQAYIQTSKPHEYFFCSTNSNLRCNIRQDKENLITTDEDN
jgi:hypothetical protein